MKYCMKGSTTMPSRVKFPQTLTTNGFLYPKIAKFSIAIAANADLREWVSESMGKTFGLSLTSGQSIFLLLGGVSAALSSIASIRSNFGGTN
jgi:hypothetical protein